MNHDTGTATAEAATTDEPIGSTPALVDIAKKDELADLGFRGDHLKSGWVGSEMLGDRRVGPFDTLAELVVAVREEVQKTGVLPNADGFETVDLDEPIEGDEMDRIEAIIGEADEGYHEEGPELDEDETIGDAPDDLPESDESEGMVELKADSRGNTYMPGMEPQVNQELTNAVGKYHAIKTERVALTRKETEARDELKVAAERHANLFVPDPDNSDCVIYRAGDLVCRKKTTHEEKYVTEIADGDF